MWAGFAGSSGHLGVTGILPIAAGVALFAWPKIGTVSLAIVLGIYLAIHGIALLVAASEASHNGRVPDRLAVPERGIA
jgi:uncharacterized membrane protein HdeD (DUF308 family)